MIERQRKKVLSLVLAMAMMLSVMVVGAGASYTDVDEIENLDAVYLLTALDIVEGREDGNYDATATLNRAEAAKLVAILNLASNPVPNANGKSDFTDVLGDGSVAWANDFIQYGVAQGSIDGMGDGTFGAKLDVTGVQLAKMLLGILGFDAAEEGYTGARWEFNVNIDASAANLYKGLEDIDPTDPITRDDAAQMLYNALQAWTVIYLTDTTGALKITGKTLMDVKYPFVEVYEGVLAEMEYDVEDGEYTYEVNNDGQGDLPATTADYTDLFGYNVVYYTDKVAGETVLLGMYDYYNTVETGLWGDYEAPDADDVDEDAAAVMFVTKNNSVALSDLKAGAFHDYYTYKAIDNDDVAGYDYLIVYPVYDEEVGIVAKDGIQTNFGTNKTYNYLYEDCTIESGLAKGDMVMIVRDTTLKTDWIVSKLALEKGTVDHFTSKYNAITKMTVGSDEYDICTLGTDCSGVYLGLAGKKVSFNVINGYAVNVKIDDSVALSDLLLVTALEQGYDADGTYDAYAMFSDGAINPIDISKVVNGKVTDIEKYVEKTSNFHGYLAKYDVVDGAYELTPVANIRAEALGFDRHIISGLNFQAATPGDDDAMINNVEFADDAIVYMADVSGSKTEYSVVSGADVATLTDTDNADLTIARYAGVEKAADGHEYVTFAFIETYNVHETADAYGILTSDVEWYDFNDARVDYATFSIWNGTEELTITAQVGEVVEDVLAGGAIFEKGDVIVYSTDNSKIINMENLTAAGVMGSVVAYNVDNYKAELHIDTYGNTYDVTDALIIGAAEGVSAELDTAKDTLTGLVQNIMYFADADGIYLIIVDEDGVDLKD